MQTYVTLHNAPFHYTRLGLPDGPSLLLLHGFSDNGRCWLPAAQELAADYDVILPDARGHGRSPRLQPGESVDQAADAAALITALGLRKPVVIGHSMGGLAATELGARFPALVAGLILEDPAWIDPPPDEVPPAENPFFAWLSDVQHATLDDIIARGQADNPAWAAAEFPAWAESKRQLDLNAFAALRFRKPWRQFVAALTVPTLLITAEPARNALITLAQAREAAALTPHLQVAHVPNAGHNIRRENYPAFMAAVRTFLASFAKES